MIGLLTLLLASLFLDQQIDTSAARDLLDKGREYYRARTYDSAELYYREAIEAYKLLDSADQVGFSYLSLGNTLYRQRRFTDSEEALLMAEQVYLQNNPPDDYKLFRVYRSMGALYQVLAKTIAQREYLEKAHEIVVVHYGLDHLHTAISFAGLGLVASEFGDYEKALTLYHKALPKYLEESPDGHSRVSSLLINMGITYSKLEDTEHAIEYIKRAIEVDKKLGPDQDYLLSYNYLNLAQIYKKTDRDSLARESLLESLSRASKYQIHQVHATCIYELGQLAERSGDDPAANAYYQEAVEIMEDGLGAYHQGIAFFLESRSDLSLRMHDFDAAARHADRTLKILKDTYGERHPRIGEAFAQKARVARAQSQFGLALNLIDSAIMAQSPQMVRDARGQEELVSLSPASLLRILKLKASILQQMGDLSDDLSFKEDALDLYKEMTSLMDRMRRGFMNEESKLFFQDRAVEMYDRAIQLCLVLYELTQDQKYLDDIFFFCERNKSVVLSEGIHSKEVDFVHGIPPELLEREIFLQTDLDKARNALIEDSDSTNLAWYSLRRQQYDSIVVALRDGYPYYFELKFGGLNSSLAGIRSSLSPEEAMISYFRGDSLWTILTITQQGVDIDQTPVEELDSLLREFRSMVVNPSVDFNQDLAFALGALILPRRSSWGGKVKKLIVVPDGLIGHIPVEAVLMGKEDGLKASYLINNFEIIYAQSAEMYFREGIESNQSDLRYAGFAPMYDQAGNHRMPSSLGSLPHAREEVIMAQDLLGGKIFLDEAASELNLLGMSSRPAILHLAMHTLVDDENPNFARLLFSDLQDTSDAGSLHAYEIYGADFSSQLLLLSACNTGFGPMQRGEGILSLSRAFAFAGCRNLVMSLWQARDQPTSAIIRMFLEGLLNNDSKSSALRQAKLDYLKEADPLMAHPANWAALTLIGDQHEIDLDVRTLGGGRFWTTLLALVLVIGLLFCGRSMLANHPNS